MLRILLDLKFIKIYTFGVFLVLAFFWGSYLLWKLIRLTSHKEEEIFDGVFLGLFGGIFFGRLLYVVLNFADFGFDFFKFILINGYPGLSLVGTLVGGLLTLKLYFLAKKIRFRQALDYFIPAIFVALGIGKLGAFISGTEVGAKTKFLLAVKYVGYDGLRHITPFWESLAFLLAAFITYKLIFEIRKEKYPSGFALYFLLWYFGLIYVLFDRLKQTRLFIESLNFNFVVALIMFLTGSIYFIYYFRHRLFELVKIIRHSKKNHGKKSD